MSEKKKKVLIVCDSTKYLIDFRGKLIEEMVKKHQVFVFTPAYADEQLRQKLTTLNVTVFESQLTGSNVSIFSDIKYFIQLLILIKRIKPDVFFPYTVKPVVYGTIAAKIFRIKKIIPMLTGLGYSFSEKSKNTLVSKLTHILLKFTLKSNRRLTIIFQNNDDYQLLLHLKIITKLNKTFTVNGSGVDLAHYEYSEPDTNNISFIMVSRLINAKGIREYYESAKYIKAKYPFIKFKLIGPYDKNIDAINPDLFNKIKFGNTISYLGEVKDPRPYIAAASVVVLPSYREGVPRSLLESMSMGRAIITCNSPGCKETVEKNEAINGFLVPIKNVDALTSKMEFFINNKASIRSFGINGRVLARKKFDVNLINAEMLKVMELA